MGTVNQNDCEYELFIAKKNGGRNNDYPSLEKHQLINKFGSTRFFLKAKC
jgi:hypothetical protein